MLSSAYTKCLVLSLMLLLSAAQAFAVCFDCLASYDVVASDSLGHSGHGEGQTETDNVQNCCETQSCGAGNCFSALPSNIDVVTRQHAPLTTSFSQALRSVSSGLPFRPPINY